MSPNLKPIDVLPNWVPSAVRLYLDHTENGSSLREIARAEGVHASTVLRQVRRFENRRDDPLVDCALGRLKRQASPAKAGRGARAGTGAAPDTGQLAAEARRVLRRLCEPGAMMVVAPDMARAVVLRDAPEGALRLAVLDRPVAEAFALRDWIACRKSGRVARYEITPCGRSALRRLLEESGEVALPPDDEDEPARRMRYGLGETPVTGLARRRDRNGKPFLSAALVAAAERLREDFEIAQIGPQTCQNWERHLTGNEATLDARRGPVLSGGAAAARERVAAALHELGPGLGDMVLRCCCFLEGLETAERRLGWSARSGKIVLRIALMRLERHYQRLGEAGKMIG